MDCFAKDGALGTLVGSQQTHGIDDDGQGTIFQLVSPSVGPASVCATGCELQRIDSKASLITEKVMHPLPGSDNYPSGFRYDRTCDRAVVGYRNTQKQHVVRLLAF